MEPQFISEFEITFARYWEWACHPLGRKAVRSRRLHRILMGIVIVCGVLLVPISALTGEFYGLILGIGFIVLGVLRLFIMPKVICKRQYKTLLEIQMREKYLRKTVFSDRIITTEGNTSSELSYDNITNITQDACYFYLWRGVDYVFRLPKDSFIKGSASDFLPFIRSAVKTATEAVKNTEA